MSCSARYPVYILLISAFFTEYRGSILFAIYLLGIVLAGAVAWILKKTLFKVETIPFVMELPPYRVPTIRSVLKQTWFKGEQYLRKMGTIILAASIIIWALSYFPRGEKIDITADQKIEQAVKSFTSEMNRASLQEEEIELLEIQKTTTIQEINLERQQLKQENSFIGKLGKFIEPIIRPLGFDWKMGVSLIAGSAAKEIVISTMGVLYQTDPSNEDNINLIDKIKDQKYTEGKRAGELVFTPLVAMSFMLFILIYFPCIAVVAAIKNESGKWKWSVFLTVYTTILAWMVSFLTYQGGTWLGF
jgi:ferrous iron transport protein B